MRQKKIITMALVLAMLLSVTVLVSAKTAVTEQTVFLQDFQGFSEGANVYSGLGWYNDTDNRGFPDFAAETDLDGYKMGVGGKYRTVMDISSYNGIVSVAKDGDNKYLYSSVKAEENYVGFVLDNTTKDSNLVLSFDARMPVDGTSGALRFVYEKDGTKEISKIMDWIYDYGSVWLYTETGNSKSYIFESIKDVWVTYTMNLDIANRTYSYKAETKDGTVLDTKSGLKLPATTADNLYGFEFHFKAGNTTAAFCIDNVELKRNSSTYYLDSLQDFENYTVGNYGTSTFGGWNSFAGGMSVDGDIYQAAGSPMQINSKANGSVEIGGNDTNKYASLYTYLEGGKTPADLGYSLAVPCDDYVRFSFDARMQGADATGGYMRLMFTDDTTTSGEYVNLLWVAPWSSIYCLTENNEYPTIAFGDVLTSMFGKWVTFEVQIDVNNSVYSVFIIDKASGVVLGRIEDKKLPSKTYGKFRGFDILSMGTGAANPDRKSFDIDNVTVKSSKPKYTKLEISGGGSVKINNHAVANGDMVVADALSVTATPENGYELSSVKLGDTSLVIDDKTGYTFEVAASGGDILYITFAERTAEKATIDEIYDAKSGEYTDSNGKKYNSILAFSKLNLNYGWSIDDFGFVLSDDKDNSLNLPVDIVNITGDGTFAIRMYGDALISGKTYKLKPYLNQSNGEENSEYVSETSVSVTIE